MLGATNRNPDRFVEPPQLNLLRPHNHHLAFGFGAHHCQGDHLTYVAGSLALERILERFLVAWLHEVWSLPLVL